MTTYETLPIEDKKKIKTLYQEYLSPKRITIGDVHFWYEENRERNKIKRKEKGEGYLEKLIRENEGHNQ